LDRSCVRLAAAGILGTQYAIDTDARALGNRKGLRMAPKYPFRIPGAVSALEMRPPSVYRHVINITDDKIAPDWLTQSLERSEAQIAAGQTLPLEPVLDRLRASIARMKAAEPPVRSTRARKV
jgi:hypothetical protein